MSFITLKVTMLAAKLPRGFSWLRHHTCYFSIAVDDATPEFELQVFETVTALLHAKLAGVRQRATCGEYGQILGAIHREYLDWNGSTFDVLGIDVTWDRVMSDHPLAPGLNDVSTIDGEDEHAG